MIAKSFFHSENTRSRLAIAEEPAGNQENATQSLVLDQARNFKQMHGRCGTMCYPKVMFSEECVPLRNG